MGKFRILIGNIISNNILKNHDLIVNPTNPQMVAGAGVSGEIFKKAGVEELEAYTQKTFNINYYSDSYNEENNMQIGDIRITPGFNLKMDIMFVQGPKAWENSNSHKILLLVYKIMLNMACASGYKNILLPSIGTGEYGFEHSKIGKDVYQILNNYSKTHDINIDLVLLDKNNKKYYVSRIIDSLLGHAIGDAMGVPNEFKDRLGLQLYPVTEMIGYSSHPVPKGTWSDDTSMEIALIDSIINKGKFDYDDIMTNFSDWLHDAKFTAIDEVFDAGNSCIQAINNFEKGIAALECGLKRDNENGNGSLMRILPVALYSHCKSLDDNEIIVLTNNVSSLTHAHEISKLGCYIYVRFIMFLMNGLSKEEAYSEIKKINYSTYSDESLEKYSRILKNNINTYEINDISSSGYIVDSLEAAFWCVLKNDSYRNTIIEAINLGGDTDTIAAIAGSMAGIIYGLEKIPIEWINCLQKKDYLLDIFNKFELEINN